jgi:hypothetical protein
LNSAYFIASLACLIVATVALARVLPAQNVAFIVMFLACVEVAFEYWHDSENLLNGTMFWPGAIILLRMGVQRLLKPYRQSRNFGWFVIGLTSIPPAVPPLVLGETTIAMGRLCVTAVCLFFLTPWFIQKRVTTSGGTRE